MPPKPATQRPNRTLRSSSKTASQQLRSTDQVGPLTADTASSIPDQPPRPRPRRKATNKPTEALVESLEICAGPAQIDNNAACQDEENDGRVGMEVASGEALILGDPIAEMEITGTRVSARQV
jgi:hypothetical protein